jgi:EamA domain-containing membrane protein RarD
MKKFRFLPIIALVLAVGFSAFTFQNKKIKAQDPLWFYDGG